MYLKRLLAINMAAMVCIATLTLGLGQASLASLPVWTLVAAMVSLWLTDFTGRFCLSHRWANVGVLCVVGLSLGDLLMSYGDELALGITRVIVFVQIVLLFREKDDRTCWHIILLGLIQVVVASSFEQDVWFGIALAIYLFATMSTVALIFLTMESGYYQKSATAPKHFSLWSGVNRKREGWTGIFRILLDAFVITPLKFALLAFRRQQATDDNGGDQRDHRYRTVSRARGTLITDASDRRWPLSNAKPQFSGSSVMVGGRGSIHRGLWFQLAHMTVYSVMLAGLIFMFTPRVDRVRIGPITFQHLGWGKNGKAGGSMVGFSDEIQLGTLGTALQNAEPVLRIKLTDTMTQAEYPLLGDLYLRGTTLTQYESGHWRHVAKPEETLPEEFDEFGGFDQYSSSRSSPENDRFLKTYLDPALQTAAIGSDRVSQEILFELSKPNVLFCVWPFYNLRPHSNPGRGYDGTLIRPHAQGNRQQTAKLGTTALHDGLQIDLTPCEEAIDRMQMLQVPTDQLPTLISTAKQWIDESGIPEDDPVGRARYLEQQFTQSGRFSYTLTGPARDLTLDPIEDFMRNNPQGHCEYYATSLALMLRSQGIPARIMVGFRTGMYNSLGHFYQFRQLDAHSWVEAYIPPDGIAGHTQGDPENPIWETGGWLRLDSTPAVEAGMFTDISSEMTGWKHWCSFAWENYVMGMNSERQSVSIYDPIKNLFGGVRQLFSVQWWKDNFGGLGSQVKQLWVAITGGRWFSWGGLLVTMVVGLVGYGLYRLLRPIVIAMIRLVLAAQRQVFPGSDMKTGFYHELETLLARFGMKRRIGQTQQNFAIESGRQLAELLERSPGEDRPEVASGVTAEQLNQIPPDVVRAFYEVRFGQQKLDSGRTREIRNALQKIREIVR